MSLSRPKSLNAKFCLIAIQFILVAVFSINTHSIATANASAADKWSGIEWQPVVSRSTGKRIRGLFFRYRTLKFKEHTEYIYQFRNTNAEKQSIKWWIPYVNTKGKSTSENLSGTIKGDSRLSLGLRFPGEHGQVLRVTAEIKTPPVAWVPGRPHSKAQHVFAGKKKNEWTPGPGYKWENSKSGDLSVRWNVGERHPKHPNISAASKEGSWKLKDGYVWRNPGTSSDLRTKWGAGRSHPSIRNVVASPNEGKWRPRPGYVWIKRSNIKLGVKWKKGINHPDVANIYSSENENRWNAAPGYRWNNSADIRSGVHWASGLRHPDFPHITSTVNKGKWLPDSGYEWVSRNKSLKVRWTAGMTHRRYPNIQSAQKEGVWSANPGYRWSFPNDRKDLRVYWSPNLRHPKYPHIRSGTKIGFWNVDKGYKWVKPNSSDLRVVAIPDPNRQFLGRVSTRASSIILVYADHGSEDGDRVDIFSNQRRIASDIYLTNASKRTQINLGHGENVISFRALNTGTKGDNTAEFKVIDANGKTLIANKEWNLRTGNRAEIIVIRN